MTDAIAGDSISYENTMARRDKREERIRRNPANVSLEDFEALVRVYGYVEAGGKHHKAVIGEQTMTFKRENPVKPVYVKLLLDYIDRLPE